MLIASLSQAASIVTIVMGACTLLAGFAAVLHFLYRLESKVEDNRSVAARVGTQVAQVDMEVSTGNGHTIAATIERVAENQITEARERQALAETLADHAQQDIDVQGELRTEVAAVRLDLGSVKTSVDVLMGRFYGRLWIDEQGIIRKANARMQEVSGYEPHELIGQHMSLLVPERLRDLHARQATEFIAAAGTAHHQARMMGENQNLVLRRKDGLDTPVDIALTPILNSSTHVLAVITRLELPDVEL